MKVLFNKVFRKVTLFIGIIIFLGCSMYLIKNELTPIYKVVSIENGDVMFTEEIQAFVEPMASSSIVAQKEIQISKLQVEESEYVEAGTLLFSYSESVQDKNNNRESIELLEVENQAKDNIQEKKRIQLQLENIKDKIGEQQILFKNGAVARELILELEQEQSKLIQELEHLKSKDGMYQVEKQAISKSYQAVNKEALYFTNEAGLFKQVGKQVFAAQKLYIMKIEKEGVVLNSGSSIVEVAAVTADNIVLNCPVPTENQDKFVTAPMILLNLEEGVVDAKIVKKVGGSEGYFALKGSTDEDLGTFGAMVTVTFKGAVDAKTIVPTEAIIPKTILKDRAAAYLFVIDREAARKGEGVVKKIEMRIVCIGDMRTSIDLGSDKSSYLVIKHPQFMEIEGTKVRIDESK